MSASARAQTVPPAAARPAGRRTVTVTCRIQHLQNLMRALVAERKVMPPGTAGGEKKLLFNQDRLSVQDTGPVLPFVREEDLELSVARHAQQFPVLGEMAVANGHSKDLPGQELRVNTGWTLLCLRQLPVCAKNALRNALHIQSAQIKHLRFPLRMV